MQGEEELACMESWLRDTSILVKEVEEGLLSDVV